MKRRNFYPLQVMRSLDGCNPLALEPGESVALAFFLRKARRHGHAIAIINARSDISGLAKASPAEQRAVIDNTNLRIVLRMPSKA
jgi:hypothetical protein